MTTRIALLEDDPRYRAGLAGLLSAQPGFEVAAVFDAVKPFLAAMREQDAPWDLVVSDLGLPDGKGVDAIREVKRVAPTVTVVAANMKPVNAAWRDLRTRAVSGRMASSLSLGLPAD